MFALFLILVAQPAHAGSPLSGIQIDGTRIPQATQEKIRDDFELIARLQFDAESDSAFARVFGGGNSELVERYLAERIRYLGVDTTETPDDPSDNDTCAANFGPNWLSYYYHHDVLGRNRAKPQLVDFRNEKIPLLSPRTGFVAIGKAYTDPSTSQIDRIDTWVHEARHSDCAKIPSLEDLARYDRDRVQSMSDQGKACGHMHVKCPKDHALAGEEACDDIHWGAYTMGYIYSRAVYKNCRDCSEEDRQAGLASASDDFSRLSKPVQDGLLQGTSPKPNMSSLH